MIDLSKVEHMDTAGAWLIDRSRQGLVTQGVDAEIVGARPEYTLLLPKRIFVRPTRRSGW